MVQNSKYDKALEAMAKGKRVLDVGTGTGLLAMLAARHGASKVIACEVRLLSLFLTACPDI